jgi:hypothetical protein
MRPRWRLVPRSASVGAYELVASIGVLYATFQGYFTCQLLPALVIGFRLADRCADLILALVTHEQGARRAVLR